MEMDASLIILLRGCILGRSPGSKGHESKVTSNKSSENFS